MGRRRPHSRPVRAPATLAHGLRPFPGMSEVRVPSDVLERLSSRLEERAEAITDDFVDELRKRLKVRHARILPTASLRDHVPRFCTEVARALLLGQNYPSDEIEDYLRMYSELRREQSYPVGEVLLEFELLADLLFQEASAVVRAERPSPEDTTELFALLRPLLAGIGRIAVDTYQEASLREKQEIAVRLSDFARTLEHELRGPLQSVAASAHLLRSEKVASNQSKRERHADMILRRLKRIGQLVDDIRELAVAEHGLTEEKRKHLREVIDEVLGEVRDKAEEHQVRIEIAEPVPEIRVDTARIEVALMNLISNAIKYSDPDKDDRWVRVATKEVESREEKRWTITVEDNGLGIPTDLKYQVFQRRFRAHPAHAQGTGMGLAIVKEVMEQRGGAVSFESEEGAGSRFVLDITPRLASGGEQGD